MTKTSKTPKATNRETWEWRCRCGASGETFPDSFPAFVVFPKSKNMLGLAVHMVAMIIKQSRTKTINTHTQGTRHHARRCCGSFTTTSLCPFFFFSKSKIFCLSFFFSKSEINNMSRWNWKNVRCTFDKDYDSYCSYVVLETIVTWGTMSSASKECAY